eukprot:12057699-Ditylum_brightwellii.AAC.1
MSHEILVNEGRRDLQRATKILALHGVDHNIENPMENKRGQGCKVQLDGRSMKKQQNFTLMMIQPPSKLDQYNPHTPQLLSLYPDHPLIK